MSEASGYSPSFKRPPEIIRMRSKRARSQTGARSGSSTAQGSPSAACVQRLFPVHTELPRGPHRSSAGGAKRRNPFANVANKRSVTEKVHVCDEEEDSYKSTKWTSSRGGAGPCLEHLVLEAEITHDVSNKPCSQRPGLSAPPPVAPPVCTEYPADWSLKTRLLFTSPKSLTWAEKPRAQEEALGLHQHCTAQFSTLSPVSEPGSCSELRCAFQQSLVYWQHPSLSWLSLFPRINAEGSFAGQSAPWAQDPALQQSLMREWSVSLSSLYGLLKSARCPYFYICTHQFTVLFRAAGIGGCSNISALISPTTRGLREALKTEGIEFSVPLLERMRRRSTEKEKKKKKEEEREGVAAEEVLSSEPMEDEAAQSSDGEDEDGCFSWLKEMGIQDQIRKSDGIILQLQKEAHTVALDHKPESVVFVEGSHTFTLINFLINSRHVVAAAGPQAGLPPTLLAPVAFKGATLQTLKSRSVNVQTQVGSTYQSASSLEIAGPVLPSSLHAITTLLGLAQHGNFSAALYTHAPTAVLNVHASKLQPCVDSVDLSACGLHPASTEQLQRRPRLDKTALTHLQMSSSSYTWRSEPKL